MTVTNAKYNIPYTEAVRAKYSTFSATDISLYFAGVEIGNATGLKFQTQRQKTPAWVFGAVNPIGFTRGYRMITGILSEMYISGQSVRSSIEKFEETHVYRPISDTMRMEQSTIQGGTFTKEEIEGIISRVKHEPILFLDELFPFDLIIVGADEFGNIAKVEILGCEFNTEGTQINMSNSNSVIGAAQFIARNASPMYQVTIPNVQVIEVDG